MLTSEYTRRISRGTEPDVDRFRARARKAIVATLAEAKRSNARRRIVTAKGSA